MISLICQR